MTTNSYAYNKERFKNFRINCEKCFGFCCVALYFSASEGFPTDKVAGKPCINLKSDFTCLVHNNLRQQGLKGCTAYDCFGAGQKVAQITYKGENWRDSSQLAKEMFDVFLVMRQLHEMLWYLTEASMLESAYSIKEEIDLLIRETEEITNLSPKDLIELDIVSHREKVNVSLRQASELVKENFNLKNQKELSRGKNFIGKKLKKVNLIGSDLRGALLIAADLSGNDLSGANLIGADMRDTDIRGTNLKNSVFLTQSQINTAKGDINTKLPDSLIRPRYWGK